jgi:hypothetical protein
VEAAGNKPKRIEEFAGASAPEDRRERREDGEPAGLEEPPQTPGFKYASIECTAELVPSTST